MNRKILLAHLCFTPSRTKLIFSAKKGIFQQQPKKAAKGIYVMRAVQKCTADFPKKLATCISVMRAAKKCS
jgi:hypothetical protein